MRMNPFGTRLVTMPSSMAEITAIDPAEADPGLADLSPAAVEAIWRRLEEVYRSGAYPGVGFCLRRRGVVVLNRALGHARGNGPADSADTASVPMGLDTPVCLFSASKAVTAVLVHKLAEEGGVDLDAPVARYIPEFGANGKAETTVSQVLAHRSGFPMFDVPAEDAKVETLLDWERCVDLICGARPIHHSPRMAYHAITGGFILAELIRRVTQRPFVEYLDSRIRQPMGMRHFTFGVPEGQHDQVAFNYCAGQPVRFPLTVAVKRALGAPFEEVVEVSNQDAFMNAVIPAGNLYATAEELSRFFQMLLDGGRYGDHQVLQPETVRRAVRPNVRMGYDRTLMIPMRYSEGMMLGANPVGLYGPMTGRAYGHLGFMNILGWADPARDVSASLLVTGKALLGGHLLAWSRLLTTIARRCR